VSDRTLHPLSALSGIAVPGRYGRGEGEPSLVITELTGLGLATVACRKGQAAALSAAVRNAYGVDLPASSRVAQGAAVRFIGYGPGQWLAVSVALANEALAVDLAAKLQGLASVSDQSGGRTVLRIGGSRVLRSSDNDDVTIVGAGVTVQEALKAAEALAEDGIDVRVIDAYSIKPIDGDAVRAAARECGAIVTVEDHWPEGGLGEAVLAALASAEAQAHVVRLAVTEMPRSGKPEQLLSVAGIDAQGIAATARRLVRTQVTAS